MKCFFFLQKKSCNNKLTAMVLITITNLIFLKTFHKNIVLRKFLVING